MAANHGGFNEARPKAGSKVRVEWGLIGAVIGGFNEARPKAGSKVGAVIGKIADGWDVSMKPARRREAKPWRIWPALAPVSKFQ